MPGNPSQFSFESGMEEELILFKAKKVYRIVSVIQPPFMLWNETKRKNDQILQFDQLIVKILISEVYEGYAYDLINEIKEILIR